MVVILSPGCYFGCVEKIGWCTEQRVNCAGVVKEAYHRRLYRIDFNSV